MVKKFIEQHPFIYFIGLCLALLVLYYSPFLFCKQTFFTADNNLYFEPLVKFIAQSWHQGRIPMWNPYVHCGMAQIAVPSPGVFYLPNLIFDFCSYGQGLAVIMILHQMAAAIGAYLFIYSLGLGIEAAFVAGFVAAFSGYMFSLTTNYTLVASIAWLPLDLWAMRSIHFCKSATQKYLFASLGAFATFMIIAAGRPEIGVPAAGIVVAFVCFQTAQKEDAPAIAPKAFMWECLALLSGLLLGMIVILPAVEWLTNSPRSTGIGVEYVFLWSANWYDILMMFFAQPFGDVTRLGAPYLHLAADRSGHLPFVPSTLIGPVIFSLAILGFSDRSWKERKWVLLVLLLSSIMVIGHNTYFVPKLFEHLPFANLFRYPIKLIIFPILCLALAAAYGMRSIVTHRIPQRALLFTIALWTVSFLVGLIFAAAGLLSKPLPILELAKFPKAQLLLGEAILIGSIIGLVFCLIASLVKVGLVSAKVPARKIAYLVLASLVIPAIFFRSTIATKTFYGHKPYLLTKLESLALNPELNKERLLPVYFDPLILPKNYSWSKDATKDLNYYGYCRDLMLPNTNLDWHQCETFGYEAAETKDYRHLYLQIFNDVLPRDKSIEDVDDLALFQFCRTTATNWLTTQIHYLKIPVPLLDKEHFELLSEESAMNLRIYKVNNTLPRAFVAREWHWATSHTQVLEDIRDPESSNFDPETNAQIEQLSQNTPAYPALMPPGSIIKSQVDNVAYPAKKDVTVEPVFTQQGYLYPIDNTSAKEQKPIFLKDLPDHISISANLEKANFLILADQYYPGWTASIDGVAVPIFRANGTFKAVYVPSGGHLIQFDYEPDSLRLGFYLFLTGLSLLAGFLWLAAYPTILRTLRRMAGEI